jgi:hypothetical protein
MSDNKGPKPFYYAWHPVVESPADVVSVLLSRGSNLKTPLTGNKFALSVAAAAGLNAPQIMFGCDEFVTSYFSGVNQSGREWQECWDMRLLFSEEIPKGAVKDLIKFPIEEPPDSIGEFRVQIPVRVIADFDSLQMCTKCKDTLQERAMAQTIRWPDRYSIRDIAPSHQQLCIDIGTVDRSRVGELLADATTIMTICEEMGGRTLVPHWHISFDDQEVMKSSWTAKHGYGSRNNVTGKQAGCPAGGSRTGACAKRAEQQAASVSYAGINDGADAGGSAGNQS